MLESCTNYEVTQLNCNFQVINDKTDRGHWSKVMFEKELNWPILIFKVMAAGGDSKVSLAGAQSGGDRRGVNCSLLLCLAVCLPTSWITAGEATAQ